VIERKTALQELLEHAETPRTLYVDHIEGDHGAALLEYVRQLGGEGIVSKKATARYRAGPSRSWVKTKCSKVGTFVIGLHRRRTR
jgi:bifunctional non-homologous end joining protein LigD